ncbi:MAG: glycosyltransferase family 4 protein [Lachnospiraceae bacterium]|nr:glycosyltransferase family 4 protein [Lachnospiraceae bacterium]
MDALKAQKTLVCYIASLTRGGAERVMANLANWFAERGYRVILATLEEDEGLYPLSDKIEKRVLALPPCHGPVGRVKNLFGRVWQLRALFKEVHADVCLAFIGKTNIRAIMAALGTKTDVFVSVRSAPAREYKGVLQRMLARFAFRAAKGAAFQTAEAASFFPKSVQRRSRVLLNPLSAEYVVPFDPYEDRRDEIITVGRMDRVKNHKLLVEAFALFLDQFLSVEHSDNPEKEAVPKLIIYGGGDCMEEIRAQVKTLGIEDHVEFPGDTRDVAKKIKGARLFVLSSDFEGMPNAVAEAMAMSIPVVATDCPSGGVRSLVKDGETGLLVPVKDPQAMADAMMRIRTDRELAARLAKAGHSFSQSLAPGLIFAEWESFLF